MVNKDLSENNYIGKVISNEDPDYSGRCKIRVYGLMDDLDENLLPWFYPSNITTFSSEYGGGNLSVPKIGAYVRVKFANNDILSGEYSCIQNVDPNLKDLIKDHYIGTHVLLYDCDQELLIAFQPETGLSIYYKESTFNIFPTNEIKISEPNNNAIISLNNDTITIESVGEINVTAKSAVNVSGDVINVEGNSVNIGKNASVPAVNGTKLVEVLTDIGAQLAEKYPICPGNTNTLSNLNEVLSSTVKMSE